MKQKKIIFITNSDFGIKNTIGARALPIAKELKKQKKDVVVYCRNFNKNEKNNYKIKKVMMKGELIMKLITGSRIYISTKIPTNEIKNAIFDYFLMKKMKKENLSEVDIVQSWDFLPKTYKYIKKTNPKIKIIQDVAIALPNIIKTFKKEKFWEDKKSELDEYKKKSMKNIDSYIVPSEFVLNTLLEEKISKNDIKIIPFGVDSKVYKPKKQKQNKIFKVGFVGNISHRKGIKHMMKAWKELNLENAELNLYGTVYPEINKEIKDMDKFNVKIHGFVDIKKEIPKNHIYLFPSLSEGSSKSIYEAMASGLPIITTFNSGSVIRDKKEGFIIPIQDSKAIKEKVRYFYNNRKEIINFGKRARKLAEKYTWEKYGKDVIKAYKKTIR